MTDFDDIVDFNSIMCLRNNIWQIYAKYLALPLRSNDLRS